MKKSHSFIFTSMLLLVVTSASMAQITTTPAEGDRAGGSFPEAISVMSTYSPSSAPTASLTVGNGCTYLTITDAIAAANPGDTLMLEGGRTFTENITIPKNLILQGGFSGCASGSSIRTTITANNPESTVDIRNSEVTLRNLEITGGNSIGGGVDVDSALDKNCQVALDNVRVTGNTGTFGAGLYVGLRSVVTLINGTRIDNNTATSDGGGARVWGRLVVNSWLGGITDNSAPHGGGVSVPGGVLELRPGHVGINQATAAEGRGGGIHVYDDGMVTATNSSNVYRNSAFLGGGIFADNAQVTLGAVIHSNTAANIGGGIYLTNGSALHASNTLIGDDAVPGRGNQSAASGGGIFVLNSEVTLNNSKVLSNTANSNGGGIYVMESSVLDVLNHSVIAGNHALDGHGGGIMAQGANTINISNTRLRENSAGNSGLGGAIYQNNGTLTMAYSHLHHNSAYYGGAILQTGASASANVSNCLIHHNTVNHPLGAGIRRNNGEFTITHTTLADNIGGSGFSGVATSATNSIAWGNGGVPGFASPPVHSSCNIDDGGNAGANNDPLFVSPGAGQNYHLQKGSPAIDACTTGLSFDLDNLRRPIGSRYDMGAYEFKSFSILNFLPPIVRDRDSGPKTER